MITPGTLNLRALRWTPFVFTIDFEGYDLTGATFAAEIRAYRDAPGDPIIALANAASNAEGLSVSVQTIEGLPVSTVQIRINETTLEATLPFPGSGVKAGADISLVWDLHVTNTGLPKTRFLQGSFVIEPGSTQ